MKFKSLVTVIIILFTSCTDLEEVVYDQLTEDSLKANLTDNDIPSLLGPLYNDLRKLYTGNNATEAHFNGNWLWVSEESADLWITPKRGGGWYDGGIYYRLNQHNWGTDETTLLGVWRSFYKAINTSNRLYEQFETLENETQRNKILAEIRVSRAFWYYNLADFYGNVPLVTEFSLPDGYLPETNSRKEVVDFVINELKESIPFLDEEGYGKWNKFSASHLLAKVYLNYNTWFDSPKWDEVVALSDYIINDGDYSLESDYSQPFITENSSSPEIIMGVFNDEIYHSEQPFLIHQWTMHWKFKFHQKTETFFWGGPCATPEFINTYDSEDLRLTKSWFEGQLYDNEGDGSPMFCDPWNPRDQGKPLAYSREIILDDDGITSGEADGLRMIKYEIKKGARASLSNDFVLFRLADVYFMKAEALYWKNGGAATQEIVDLINTVRERSFENFDDSKKLTVGQLDDNRFLDEYAWEFCQEGNRRQVLIRFDQFTSRNWFLHEPSGSDHKNLFPIPLQEINANPNLIQNPGY
ncbi:RagB/SusD family nutrient uptake outer membrane protein [Robertkochia solimangrovi]|uniref:RagB/SusD family nutrient uptake outer membrane protein n=1 Tax=Robertkochia solimangrovi TaxID=2213046 RepID=UPI00117DC61B|nr:RagB/SusD family nutrient uptake outer membrane protein [Robertkochia solimangrovi]TRZ42231.1 RagB/SusD family nutrient uptake outer membrane protein [Robertkochia solimangrovi]